MGSYPWWTNGEKRWLAKCLSRADLGRPVEKYHIGKVIDRIGIYRDFLKGDYYRSLRAVEDKIRYIRVELDDYIDRFIDQIPRDVKDANDSCRLIDWILEDQGFLADDVKSQSDDKKGEEGDKEGTVKSKDRAENEKEEAGNEQEETTEKKKEETPNEDTVDQPSPRQGQDAHDHDSVGGGSSTSASPSEIQRRKRQFKQFASAMAKLMEYFGQDLEEDDEEEEVESQSPGSTTHTSLSPEAKDGDDTTTTTMDPLSPSPAGKKGATTSPEVGMGAKGGKKPSSPKDKDAKKGDTVAAQLTRRKSS
ncbi:NADPH-cytochrome P450 reductase [Apiospora arundinis]